MFILLYLKTFVTCYVFLICIFYKLMCNIHLCQNEIQFNLNKNEQYESETTLNATKQIRYY